MLQNTRVTVITFSELLTENQLGGGKTTPPPSPNIQTPTLKMGKRFFFIIMTTIFCFYATIQAS